MTNDNQAHKDLGLGSRLCTSCGLCCDGTLFAKATIYGEENLDDFHRRGLIVDAIGKKPVFHLPCPVFNGVCSIYDQRFQICRRFRCALLIRVDQGECSADDALLAIRRARQLAEEIRSLLPKLGVILASGDLMEHCRFALASPPLPDAPITQRSAYGRLALASHELAETMHRHFYKTPKDAAPAITVDGKMD